MGKLAKQKQAALGDKYIGTHGTHHVIPGGKAKKQRREAAINRIKPQPKK